MQPYHSFFESSSMFFCDIHLCEIKKDWASTYYRSPIFQLCVGMTGLEPATSRPPDACANQLRYIPFHKRVQKYILIVKRPNFQPYFSSFTSKNMSFHTIGQAAEGAATAYCEGRAGKGFCERPSFALQKATFHRVKDGLSQAKRPPFAKPP